ncbi:MAG: sugar phosphate nucleotidyltransferase [Chloroflexi bacterium]|nr:sugar phosphate nucleotidyltransferase [Chloroflexota bacterium]
MEPLGVILTGGRATRLRPLSEGMPKSLIPLLNRPLIAYSLEMLASTGIREIVVVVGADDVRTGPVAVQHAPPGVRVTTASQMEPRGSGDALLSVGNALDGRHVVVAAVDTVLRGDLGPQVRAFTGSAYDAWVTLKETDRPREMGIVVLEGDRVMDLVEKPAEPRSNLALVAIWMLAPGAVEYLRDHPMLSPRGEVELTHTLDVMLREGHGTIGGAVFEGDWLDTGTLASLLRTQAALLDVPALVAPDATIEGSRLGPNVVIGAGATLIDVTLSNALVAPGARLEHVQANGIVVTADGQVASA